MIEKFSMSKMNLKYVPKLQHLSNFFDDVVTATNGEEGLKAYTTFYYNEHRFFDIVLTDIKMPKLNGIALSQKILTHHPEQVIIIMSAHNDATNLFQLINMGVTHFILKPLQSERFIYTLGQVITKMHEHDLAAAYTQEIQTQNRTLKSENIALQKELQIHTLLDNQSSLVALFDTQNYTLVDANQRFLQSYQLENIESFNLQQCTIAQRFKAQKGFIDASLSNAQLLESLLDEEGVVHRAQVAHNKRVITYSLTATLVSIESRDFFLLNIIDISESEALRLKAEKAERLKSNFLATMSHELRTPIHGIHGFTHLLKESALDSEQSHYVNLIETSASTLLATVNEVLDFSKIEAKQMRLDTKEVNLKALLNDFVALFKEQARQKQINFTCTIDDALAPTILLDEYHLKQILSNLLSNAIKFTPAEGEVALTLECKATQNESQSLLFSVKDSGKGIDKAQQKHIFTPFAQEDESIQNSYGGTGLGLSIAKSLVELMGGKLGLESTPNEGSHFFFVLEFVTRNAITPKDTTSFTKTPFDLQVLIAEDYEMNQLLILELLKKHAITADIANNGQEALQMSQQRQYDLILMDINMPIMSGLDASIAILSEQSVPIVALTANIDAALEKRAKEAGMQRVLTKPLDPVKLAQLLHSIATPTSITSTTSAKRVSNYPFMAAKEALELDETIITKLVQTFAEKSANSLDIMYTALDEHQLGVIADEAHRLKGSSSTLAFDIIYEEAKALEQMAKKEQASTILAKLDTIKSTILEIKTHLTSL